MNRKFTMSMVLVIVLTSTLGVALNVHRVEASGTIYIKADGSIDPPTANITTADNLIYVFTNDNYDEIVVERNNIIIDGNRCTLQGPGISLFDPSRGISLSGKNNVTIRNLSIKEFNYGIWLNSSSNDNSLYRNNITENRVGISLEWAQSNTIAENNIMNNLEGMMLWDSSNNILSGNNITESGEYGIFLSSSSNNLLRDNLMSDNQYNLHAPSSPKYLNDIDDSNMVDGKPVYFWVNEQDMAVPLGAGYVALVNCTHMTVQNLSLTNNGQGVSLINTNNSKIVNNNIANNFDGISLYKSSSNNTISGNNLTNNMVGISLSSNNKISGNNIADNLAAGIILGLSSNNIIISNNNIIGSQMGIQFLASSNNTISRNNIANNSYGIQLNSGETLGYSSNSNIYHNNFVGNTRHVAVIEIGDIPASTYTNFWDDGYPSGGNYWSDYIGVDSNHNGIGDSEHALNVNNQDNYPLMGLFSSFNASSGYHVNIVSNSTVDSFQFYESNSSIKMYVSNMNISQAFGFCRVCIPKDVIAPPYNVTINDGEIEALHFNDTLYDNGTHRWIYFSYPHSIHEIDIVPEFPSLLILQLFIVATLTAITVYRRKIT